MLQLTVYPYNGYGNTKYSYVGVDSDTYDISNGRTVHFTVLSGYVPKMHDLVKPTSNYDWNSTDGKWWLNAGDTINIGTWGTNSDTLIVTNDGTAIDLVLGGIGSSYQAYGAENLTDGKYNMMNNVSSAETNKKYLHGFGQTGDHLRITTPTRTYEINNHKYKNQVGSDDTSDGLNSWIANESGRGISHFSPYIKADDAKDLNLPWHHWRIYNYFLELDFSVTTPNQSIFGNIESDGRSLPRVFAFVNKSTKEAWLGYINSKSNWNIGPKFTWRPNADMGAIFTDGYGASATAAIIETELTYAQAQNSTITISKGSLDDFTPIETIDDVFFSSVAVSGYLLVDPYWYGINVGGIKTRDPNFSSMKLESLNALTGRMQVKRFVAGFLPK